MQRKINLRKAQPSYRIKYQAPDSQATPGNNVVCLHQPTVFRDLSVQFISVAQLCPTLCDSMNCSTPGLPVHHQLPEFTQTHVLRVGDAIHHLILYCPLLLLPPIPPSIRVFSNESTLRMRWPKYWSLRRICLAMRGFSTKLRM